MSNSSRSAAWRWVSAGVFALVAAGAAGAAGVAHADDVSPMKAWMKKNMGATRASNDFPGLAAAFDKVAADIPDPTWTEWAPISKQGTAASKAENMKGVKEACNGCHVKYKDSYKAKFATRPAPRSNSATIARGSATFCAHLSLR